MLKFSIVLISFLLFHNNSFSKDEYFLTLRFDEVNLRQGPSREYPVKIYYKKKYTFLKEVILTINVFNIHFK